MKRLFPVLVVSLLSAACGDAPTTSDVSVAEPKDAALLAAGDEVTLDVPYGNCPTVEMAQSLCQLLDPAAVLNSYCRYEDCFEMSYGGEVRVVAADELGAFPRTWFMWGMGYDVSYSSCNLTPQKHKTRIEIPLENFCYVSLEFPEFHYSEHFASNPATGCLGWFECKAP